ESLRIQSLNRAQRIKKFNEDGFDRPDSPQSLSGDSTSLMRKKYVKTSENDSTCGSVHENDGDDTEGADTERSAASTPLMDMSSALSVSSHLPIFHEIELVFKPLPHQMDDQDLTLTQTRYIKTTTNASVDHLVKYLSMRHILDSSNGNSQQDVKETASEASLFTIYVAAGPGQYQPLVGPMTLYQINDKYWRAMSATAESVVTGKTWELSLYELHRSPQEVVTDTTEIAVSPRSLHSELMCPICLDMLKCTMTTKECLHRFCQECIITALRSGNKECPTCRKKLISKRSLRHDPNFDMLISKIYPSRDEYEAHQEKVLAKLNKHHSHNFVNNIEESLRIQSLNRAQRIKKFNEDGFDRPDSPQSLSGDSTSLMRKKYVKTSENDSTCGSVHENDGDDTEGADTERSAASTPLMDMSSALSVSSHLPIFHEIELVFKPLPHQMDDQDLTLTQTRYIKTTTNASVDHLVKYLSMRHILDSSNGNSQQDVKETASEASLFTIYVAAGPGQYQPLVGPMTLYQINDKYWRVNRPLELFYAYKMQTTS
ncbi:unnamed protein product, partial [Medioppia subpectinata]